MPLASRSDALDPSELVGVASIEIPEHSGVANAVGAAVYVKTLFDLFNLLMV